VLAGGTDQTCDAYARYPASPFKFLAWFLVADRGGLHYDLLDQADWQLTVVSHTEGSMRHA
jgi:hypothetical protein